jgi:predicted nuclease of predicted toxin-antitoxin system
MRILVDENIPALCVEHLRATGHEVADVRGTAEEGVRDEELWKKARREKRLLITTDKGFARNRHEEHNGLLIVALRRPNRRRITERVIEAMSLFPVEEWPDLLVIMRDTVMSTWRAAKEK